MSAGDIKAIPSGFLGRLLREFGIEWTHLVVISGVVFSSFGLEKYLNPGIWILGTVASFSVVYLFRLRIKGNFPTVFFWSILIIVAGLASPLIYLLHTGEDVAVFLKTWTEVGTLYSSIIIGVPLGVSILSYRAQEEFLRTPLPAVLDKAAKESVSQSDFVLERAAYQIQFSNHSGNEVVMRFDVNIEAVNRLNRPATYNGIFDPAGRNKRFHYASIDGSPLNEQDPDRLTKRGLIVSHEVAANGKFLISVSGESTYYDRDSEIVGVYRPCAAFSLLIKVSPGLSVNVQSLLRKKVDPRKLANGDLLVEYNDGLLPFQGMRLFWERA